jgi:hypothetical protein
MARSSTIPGHILTTHLPPSRRKKGDGPLVHGEIYFKQNNSKATLPTQRTYPVAFMVGVEVDVMKSEPEEDDLIGDDTTMDDGNTKTLPTSVPKFKSTIMDRTSRLSDGGPDNTKRSFRKETDSKHNSHFAARK